MEAPFPKSPSHPVTAEGIALHWACDRVLGSWSPLNDLDPLALSSFLGQRCPENGVLIDDEMIYGGTVYLENIWERVHGHLSGLQTEKQLTAHTHIKNNAGRCDALWRSQDRRLLTIWDLKYGYRSVRAFENWQALNYVLAAIEPETVTVEIIIVQPRGASAAHPVKTWQLSASEFHVKYAPRLVDSANEARSERPRVFAGPHCYRCKAGHVCETSRAAANTAMDLSGYAVPVEISNEELGHELEQNQRAKDQLAARQIALEGLATARIGTGEHVPGHVVKTGMSNRKWPEGFDVVSLGKCYDLDLEVRKNPSPTEAETRGLDRQVIDLFTIRKATAAKLVRQARNEAREIFRR